MVLITSYRIVVRVECKHLEHCLVLIIVIVIIIIKVCRASLAEDSKFA